MWQSSAPRILKDSKEKICLNRHLGKGLAVTSFFTEIITWEEKVWLHLLEKAAGRWREREAHTHT
jgi:hypothetical protein